MRVAVFGGTGRIGRAVVQAGLAAGHELTLLSRADLPADDPRVRVVTGDVGDLEAVLRAVAGTDGVISALGPRRNTEADALVLEVGMSNITRAMVGAGVSRLVAVSGAGVDVPGDHKPVIDRVFSRVVRVAARHVVGAKQREYEVFAATDLAWTALRPPLVTDGAARGYRLSLELRPGARVTRADTGQALLDQLTDETFLRLAPFVLPA